MTSNVLETAKEWGITPLNVATVLFSGYQVARQSPFSLPVKVMQVVACSGVLGTFMSLERLSQHGLSYREIASSALTFCKNYLDNHKPTIKDAAFAQNVAYLKFQSAQGNFALEEKNLEGETLLLQACDWKNEDAEIALIKAGSNVQAKDRLGNMPLHYAALRGKLNVLQTLLLYQSNINETNLDGLTPIHLAAALCRKGCVECLLAAGANTAIKAKTWGTPLRMVLIKLYTRKIYFKDAKIILELLVKAGAETKSCDALIRACQLDNDVAMWKSQLQVLPQKPNDANVS